MGLSNKEVQEFKDISKKVYNIDLSDAEARDQGERLVRLFELLLKADSVERQRKKRLEKEPDGFCLEETEGPYNCRVCRQYVSGKQAWWDLFGVKCLDCQRNIKEGVIPAEICNKDDIWIKAWELSSEFSIHSSTVRKLRREGKLKGIDLKTTGGTTYYTVYLVKDNKKFLKDHPKKPKMKIKYIDPKGSEIEL